MLRTLCGLVLVFALIGAGCSDDGDTTPADATVEMSVADGGAEAAVVDAAPSETTVSDMASEAVLEAAVEDATPTE